MIILFITSVSSVGTAIFKITYGIEIESPDDEYLKLARESLEGAAEGLVPGAFWVDYLPILKYVPLWMPGVEFRRKAEKWKMSILALREAPFEAAHAVWVRQYFLAVLGCIADACF